MTIADWPADAGIDIASEIANMPEGATTRRGVVIFGVSGTLDEVMESAFEAGADDPHGLPNLPRAAKVDCVTYEIARDGSVTCSEGYEPLVQGGKLAFRRAIAAPSPPHATCSPTSPRSTPGSRPTTEPPSTRTPCAS